MSGSRSRDHYSYTVYADATTARRFDERRFGGPIGELMAGTQAKVVANFIGRVNDRSVLDVGTGTGRAALMLARGGARVTAVDASPQMLAVARHRAEAEGVTVRFLEGDAHALEFADRAFDVVVSLRVVMHTPEWRTCIRELCRVSDRLVILDYPSSRSFAALQSLSRRMLHALGVRTEPYRVFSDAAIAGELARWGFRVRSVHRMFVVPVAVHKALGWRRLTVRVEGALDRLGLLRIFGSPVTLVAER